MADEGVTEPGRDSTVQATTDEELAAEALDLVAGGAKVDPNFTLN
jgi:hypothetical protein